MGKSKPVTLPSRSFSTQSEAMSFFKDMLGRYCDGDRINEDDSAYLHELILRHPDPKIGDGIDYFYRERNPEQPTSGFHIQRQDGSRTDFSYPKCIKGKKDSVREYFYRACRFAVSDYLTREKNELFDAGHGVCAITGKHLTKETSEYRHTTPRFSDLLRLFKEEESLNLSYELFKEDADMQYNVRFQDQSIAHRFIVFHKANAKMALFEK